MIGTCEKCNVDMEGDLQTVVNRLFDCRMFVRDVITDGAWTGCAAGIIADLKKKHGLDPVKDALDKI